MVNDSVREELATRISPMVAPEPTPKAPTKKVIAKAQSKPSKPQESKEIKLKPSPKKIITKPSNTAEIVIKKTNRTLVEFQPAKTQLPEWRLQLQNVVQQRRETSKAAATRVSRRSRSMAVAFEGLESAEIANETGPGMIDAVLPDGSDNQLVANALKRIETSRERYLIQDPVEGPTQKEAVPTTKPAPKEYPFKIAPTPDQPPVAKRRQTSTDRVVTETKPTLVRETKVVTGRTSYDTNELDPDFIEAHVSSSFEKRPVDDQLTEKKSPQTEVSKSEKVEKKADAVATETEEYDDVAPFALRFNSGLFDLIIGSFGSLLLLAPFMLIGGSWFTVSGLFGFLFTLAIVMFIYSTTTIGIFGKSFGMHLFSLEMIDISGEEYPTFHQAAVSSSVYLLSLAFAGIGFMTCFIDEDARAIHDLASGTIVVKEF